MKHEQGDTIRNQLPQFTLNEAAFLVHAVWIQHFPDNDRLEDIVSTLNDPEPPNPNIQQEDVFWGVDREQLLKKVQPLTQAQQQEVREMIQCFNGFPHEDKIRLAQILGVWVKHDSENDYEEFFRSHVNAVGLPVSD